MDFSVFRKFCTGLQAIDKTCRLKLTISWSQKQSKFINFGLMAEEISKCMICEQLGEFFQVVQCCACEAWELDLDQESCSGFCLSPVKCHVKGTDFPGSVHLTKPGLWGCRRLLGDGDNSPGCAMGAGHGCACEMEVKTTELFHALSYQAWQGMYYSTA